MIQSSLFRSTLLFAVASVAFAADAGGDYKSQIEQWRRQREAALKTDDGWLTVSGLFWLKNGPNTVGSGPENDIVLPESAPAQFGVVTVENGRAIFTTASSAVTLNGKPVKDATLDIGGAPKVLSSGDVSLLPIKRGDRLALRLKDKNSAGRRNFTHLDWYPIDESWRITAKFVAHEKPVDLVFDNIIGDQNVMKSPGYAEFQRDGQTYRLEAAGEGRKLFFVLRDLTSGKTTYPASRFLYADAPKDGDTVILDFNTAQNPPCAFTPYATCPLPPPGNRLKLAIEAGERKYTGGGH